MISGSQMADLRLKKHFQSLFHVYLGNQNGKQAVKGYINLTKSIKIQFYHSFQIKFILINRIKEQRKGKTPTK